jgi:hypothetical protein
MSDMFNPVMEKHGTEDLSASLILANSDKKGNGVPFDESGIDLLETLVQ